jgi:hypothetical protein
VVLPELDIDEDEEEAILNFGCTRDVSVWLRRRGTSTICSSGSWRVFNSQSDLNKFVVDMACTVLLPPHAVARYFYYVESKKVEYKLGHFKPVSQSYYKAAINCIFDKYTCEQVSMQEELRLLLFSRQRILRRRMAELKASGKYPQPPNRCISSHGYTFVKRSPRPSLQKTVDGRGSLSVECGVTLFSYGTFLHDVIV